MIEAVGAAPLKPEIVEDPKRTELKKAAAEFEALFIHEMLKSMRSTVMKSDLMHESNSEDIYNSMLDAELSRFMAQSGGIGLSEVLLKQLDASPAMRDGAPEAAPAPARTAAANGPLRTPLRDYVLSSSFGPRLDPFTGRPAFHHGLDMAAAEGTPVHPAARGVVTFSGVKDGYGNVVEIEHADGVKTRYGHHSKNLVSVGDAVTPEDTIAHVGSTGRSTGPHLHFEVIRDGAAVDPNPLLSAVG